MATGPLYASRLPRRSRALPAPAEPIIQRVCSSCRLRRATYGGETPRGWVVGPSGAYYCRWCSEHGFVKGRRRRAR